MGWTYRSAWLCTMIRPFNRVHRRDESPFGEIDQGPTSLEWREEVKRSRLVLRRDAAVASAERWQSRKSHGLACVLGTRSPICAETYIILRITPHQFHSPKFPLRSAQGSVTTLQHRSCLHYHDPLQRTDPNTPTCPFHCI